MVNLRIGSITGHLFYPPAFATLGSNLPAIAYPGWHQPENAVLVLFYSCSQKSCVHITKNSRMNFAVGSSFKNLIGQIICRHRRSKWTCANYRLQDGPQLAGIARFQYNFRYLKNVGGIIIRSRSFRNGLEYIQVLEYGNSAHGIMYRPYPALWVEPWDPLLVHQQKRVALWATLYKGKLASPRGFEPLSPA